MVRFKNRWLLAELIFPEELVSALAFPKSASSTAAPLVPAAATIQEEQPDETDADTLPVDFYPTRPPFLVPSPAATSARGLVLSQPGAAKGTSVKVKEKEIWFAIKETIIDVFGDAGWALVGSSFNVRYYSPTTHLCVLRVARDHVRTLWGGLTFLRAIGSHRVAVRVLACAGTIKKAQLAAVRHTRGVVALYLANALATLPEGNGDTERARQREKETEAWEARRATIEEELSKMED